MYERAAYTAETRGVRVKVQPSYLAGRSNPDEGLWVWAYQIEIVNLTGVPVQLLSRHWIITDGAGRETKVVQADVDTANGVIHVTDGVFLPG